MAETNVAARKRLEREVASGSLSDPRGMRARTRNIADGRARNLVNVECLEYAPAPLGPIRNALDPLGATRVAAPLALIARDMATQTA